MPARYKIGEYEIVEGTLKLESCGCHRDGCPAILLKGDKAFFTIDEYGSNVFCSRRCVRTYLIKEKKEK